LLQVNPPIAKYVFNNWQDLSKREFGETFRLPIFAERSRKYGKRSHYIKGFESREVIYIYCQIFINYYYLLTK
jgi:hypothetical protein